MRTRQLSIWCRARPVEFLLVMLVAGLSACSTAAPKQTAFQQTLGSEVTSREIRIRASEYALTFSQTVELAADSILTLATERTVARNALVWNTYAVPAIYRSATLTDPLMAWIDSRVLTYQMRDYFQTGVGKDQFGELQPLAVAATHFLEGEREILLEAVDQQRIAFENALERYVSSAPSTNCSYGSCSS